MQKTTVKRGRLLLKGSPNNELGGGGSEVIGGHKQKILIRFQLIVKGSPTRFQLILKGNVI